MKRAFEPLGWTSVILVALGGALVLSPYRLGLLALVGAYAVASLAQNLLAGYAAIPSLGNVAFMATSAYTTASLISFGHVQPVPAMVLGIAAAGILGLVVGIPALRISGMHLAIVTVALVFVAVEVMGQWDQTHGQNGVSVSSPGWLLQERGLYLAAIVLSVISYASVWSILHSRSGRAILALSENPEAAAASGVNPVLYRLAAFALSGVLTGAAGIVYLYYSHTVTPGAFPLDLSLAFLTMMILGGTRSLAGSLLGALIIGLLPQALQALPPQIGRINVQQSASGIYALLLLLSLRVFPDGIWNGLKRLAPRTLAASRRGGQHPP